jgi:hypothetical protein
MSYLVNSAEPCFPVKQESTTSHYHYHTAWSGRRGRRIMMGERPYHSSPQSRTGSMVNPLYSFFVSKKRIRSDQKLIGVTPNLPGERLATHICIPG